MKPSLSSCRLLFWMPSIEVRRQWTQHVLSMLYLLYLRAERSKRKKHPTTHFLKSAVSMNLRVWLMKPDCCHRQEVLMKVTMEPTTFRFPNQQMMLKKPPERSSITDLLMNSLTSTWSILMLSLKQCHNSRNRWRTSTTNGYLIHFKRYFRCSHCQICHLKILLLR